MTWSLLWLVPQALCTALIELSANALWGIPAACFLVAVLWSLRKAEEALRADLSS